jgi:hypothetical protein
MGSLGSYVKRQGNITWFGRFSQDNVAACGYDLKIDDKLQLGLCRKVLKSYEEITEQELDRSYKYNNALSEGVKSPTPLIFDFSSWTAGVQGPSFFKGTFRIS